MIDLSDANPYSIREPIAVIHLQWTLINLVRISRLNFSNWAYVESKSSGRYELRFLAPSDDALNVELAGLVFYRLSHVLVWKLTTLWLSYRGQSSRTRTIRDETTESEDKQSWRKDEGSNSRTKWHTPLVVLTFLWFSNLFYTFRYEFFRYMNHFYLTKLVSNPSHNPSHNPTITVALNIHVRLVTVMHSFIARIAPKYRIAGSQLTHLSPGLTRSSSKFHQLTRAVIIRLARIAVIAEFPRDRSRAPSDVAKFIPRVLAPPWREDPSLPLVDFFQICNPYK